MKRTIFGLVFAVCLMGLPPTAQAAGTWLQIDSPHFTFISSDNEGRTRDVAAQFEQIRAVLSTVWPWAGIETDRPVLVLCVADDDGMKRLVSAEMKPGDANQIASIFETGPDRYYIGLRSDARAGERDGINPYSSAYSPYVALAISSSVGVPLPSWFVSGIAGVMSNTLVRENEVQVGRLHPGQIGLLRSSTRIRLRELIVADTDSPAYADPMRLRAFNAQATVLVHMLLFGDEQNRRAPQVDAFVKRLIGGASPAAAFEASLGSPDGLENEFAQYFNRSILSYRRVPADLRVTPQRWPARRLSAAEVAVAFAAYHVAIRRFNDAATDIRQARDTDAGAASVSEVEGLLFDRTNEPDKARVAFEKAVDAGSTNFYTHYRAAQMLWVGNPTRAMLTRVETLLERSVALNGSFSPSQSMLSEAKGALGKTAEAIALAEVSVKLTPASFNARFALARALSGADRPADALREIGRAAALATADSQRQAVSALRQSVTAAAVARLPPVPKPSAPPSNAVRVGGDVKPPIKVKDVRPVYPELAVAAEIQGVVIVEAVIGADGKVTQATVLRSIPLLDAAAVDAVRQWEYQPTVVDGTAVPLIHTVTVNFALQ